jgi:class 3 adenylate cyclase
MKNVEQTRCCFQSFQGYKSDVFYFILRCVIFVFCICICICIVLYILYFIFLFIYLFIYFLLFFSNRRIAETLLVGGVPPSQACPNASVLFMDVVGFTSICSRCSASQIVSFLNRLVTAYDGVLSRAEGVTKVDVIGDCIIAATGVTEEDNLHAVHLMDVALDLIEVVKSVNVRDLGIPSLQVRIGMSSGPLASGVVGIDAPHFSIFGDTVNLAARAEQTSSSGQIHYIGRVEDFTELSQRFILTKRDPPVQIKGKDDQVIESYFVSGRKSCYVPMVERQTNNLVSMRHKPRMLTPRMMTKTEDIV